MTWRCGVSTDGRVKLSMGGQEYYCINELDRRSKFSGTIFSKLPIFLPLKLHHIGSFVFFRFTRRNIRAETLVRVDKLVCNLLYRNLSTFQTFMIARSCAGLPCTLDRNCILERLRVLFCCSPRHRNPTPLKAKISCTLEVAAFPLTASGHHAEYSVLGGVGWGRKVRWRGWLLVDLCHVNKIGGNTQFFGQVAPCNSRLYVVK